MPKLPNKNCWVDYKPITEEEYAKLYELILKLHSKLRTESDRTEDKDDFIKVLVDVEHRLEINNDRIYFNDD